MPSVCWRWGKMILWCIVIDTLWFQPSASALELTGVLLLPVTLEGNPLGPVWHTASGDDGRPLGLAITAPAGVRQAPLLNRTNGEIDVPLLGVADIVAFWQYLENEFPPAMVMNLYFNGDNLTPGISVIMSSNGGISQYLINLSPQTLSLYLRDVESRPALFFDDGTARATLAAAFYFPSAGLTNQWRPSQLENLDRVGVDDFAPDGRGDGILVVELVVGGSPEPTPAPRAQPGVQAGTVVFPATPRVGEDLWVGPTPGEFLPTAATPRRTPGPEPSASEHVPTSAPTAEPDRTPTTSTTGAVTHGTGVSSTPTPAPTGLGTVTPGTPTPVARATSTPPEEPTAVTPPSPPRGDETPAASAPERGVRARRLHNTHASLLSLDLLGQSWQP